MSSPPTTSTSTETLGPDEPGNDSRTAWRLPRRARPETPRRSRPWDVLPLRIKLVGILLALLVVALAVTGAGTQYVLRSFLVGQVDDQLVTNAPRTVEQLNSPSGRGPTSYVVQFMSEDGALRGLTRPYEFEDDDVPRVPVLSTAEAAARKLDPFTARSPDGQRWRVVVLPASIGPLDGSVSVALPLEGVDQAVKRVRILVLLFGLSVTALCGLFGWYAIRRAFRPLTEVEDTAAAIARGDLSRRVPEHPSSTEVGRLTTSLNGMLSQIERAFIAQEESESRTRRFAADASHELRTPLTTIRGFAELYRQGAVREPEDVARTMGRIEDESRRMGGLVEDLLLLARLDEQRPARAEPVDLTVLAADAVHDARGLAPDRTVRLVGLAEGRGPEPATVTGDDARLRQVIANLMGNAVRHTPAGTPIEVAVGRDGATAVLEVRDHGPGIPPEHAPKVFERFYRIDSSRWRGQGGGSGLGLSIVAAVTMAHGGRVGVAPTAGGGATFRLELPLAPASATDDD